MQNAYGFLVFSPAIAAGDGQGTISGAGTYVSKPTMLEHFKEVSYVVDITGTLAGTFTLEGSNAPDRDVETGTAKWVPYTPLSIAWSSGAATFGAVARPRYTRVRLKVVVSSGSGTVTAHGSAR